MAAANVAGFLASYGAAISTVAYSASQSSKMRRALKNSSLDQGRSVMVRDPVAPRRLIYGQVLLSGTIVFIHTTGTKNEYLHLVVVLAGHECEEIGDIYFNDEVVPLSSGAATGKYAGYARVNKHLGASGQTADSDLVSETGGVWTSAHTLSGCAYVAVRLKWSADVFPNGLPTIRAKVKGKKVYDPRTTTTVYSDNSALCAADYLTDTTFGKAVAYARIREADLIEAANICDEDVVLADASTERRYTTNGTINADQDPGEVRRDLEGAMAGHIVDTGGTWTIRAGAYRSSTVTFTDDDLIGPISVQPRQSRQDTFNRVRGLYISPDNQWAPADFPSISNTTYKAADGGIWLDRDVQYNFTTSSATAQRLAKIELERGRQQITCSGLLALKAMQCMPGDTIAITRDRLGWTAKEFEVVDWTFKQLGDGDNLALGIELNVRETASGVWDWNDGEETTVDLAPNTTLPDPFTVAPPTSLSVTNSVQQQAEGTAVPRLQLTWTAPQDIHVESGGQIRIEYKLTAATDYIPAMIIRGDIITAYILAVVIGQSYDVRIRAENNLGVSSAWVTHTPVTVTGDTAAPATPTGLAAVVGTGKSVSLDWNDNTDDDLSEYGIYRSTDGSSYSKIAEVRASRFVDVDVALGTLYYYKVTAFDTSENESAASSVVTATPSTITDGSVDTTAPSTPSAPTFVSETTYSSGDGTVFARITLDMPTLPSGARLLQALWRRTGASGWIIADAKDATELAADDDITFDDLSPNVAYEFAVRALSFSNVPSAVSSTLSRTAPNTTGAPSAPSSGTLSAEAPAKKNMAGTGYLVGARARWSVVTDPALAYYEVKATLTDSDSATDYVWVASSAVLFVIPAAPQKLFETTYDLYSESPASNAYVRVRAVNNTGIASSWLRIGDALGTASAGAGNLAVQSSSDVTTTGITTGSSAVNKVKRRQPYIAGITLTGGAVTETYNLNISSYGFTVAPDVANFSATDWSNVEIRYDWDDSTSSNLVLRIRMIDGTNLPTSLIISGEIIQYN